ncbi:unnamed protein product [Mytilus edulis]|uniref:Ig-like domain-containing protein n=1 Tax=Mytilus edulis TaxID=6550 RepID=A0A8S3QM51_MYTED|nr:unnamed protein product [Mytilus edulis]
MFRLKGSPPEVAINTTHFEDKVYLQCHVSNYPGPYTLKDWEHKSESGKHIRYIINTQDSPIVLTKGNYQNSGIYIICRVKNGIHDTNGQHYHENQVVLHYEGPPVFLLNNNKTWFGQCCDEVIITLKVFNSSDITSEPTLKLTEQNDERHLYEVIGSLMNSTCRDHLVSYNVSFNVPCIELEFNVKIMKGESRNYSAKLRNIIEITLGDNYDEVEHLNYNNVIFDNVNNDENMHNDNVSSIIENNDIIFRVDVVSSDDSSSIKLSGDGYENPYQTFNLCDIDMHHYSSIVSCNYQNTIIFPPILTADTLDNLNTAVDNLKNPWLVIYKRKQ